MKGKIKILSLLLALAMVASMFVACNNNNGGNNTDDNGEKESITLTWYIFGSEPSNAKNVINKLNELSEKAVKTSVDLKFETDGDKSSTMFATGGDYDLAFTCSWYANYLTNAQAGAFYDITDMVKTAAPELYEFIPQNCWEGAKVGGKIYAVPIYKDSAAALYVTTHKEFVEAAGAMDELKATNNKLSSMTPLLKKMKEYGDKNGYPADLPAPFIVSKAGYPWDYRGWDTIIGPGLKLGVKLDGSGTTKVTSFYDDADYVDDLKTFRSWWEAGYTNKDTMTWEGNYSAELINIQQGWDGAEAIWANGKDYTVAINKIFGPIYTTDSITGALTALSCNLDEARAKRALEFYQFANLNEEYRNTIAYGIEGTDWELTSEGNVKAISDGWQGVYAFSEGTFFTMKVLAPSPADMYENLQKVNDTAPASPLVGFAADTTAVDTQIAACNNVFSKYMQSFICGGYANIDAEVAAMKKELEAAGYQDIIAELQKQIDAFIATK